MAAPDEPNVRTEDLTAYAEGRLPAGSALCARVERHLRDHPEDARRVRQYRRQDTMIREAFGTIADEPIPGYLLSGYSGPPQRRWRSVAGIAAALAIGIGAGWTAARLFPAPDQQPALLGFVERVGERIVPSSNTPVQSGDNVNAVASGNGPNLTAAGLEFVGAASKPGIEPGVFRFDYRDTRGNMIHLFVARDIAPASATIHTRAVNGRLLAYWHLGDSTWVLGGQLEGDNLIELARRIRETLGDLPERVQLDVDRESDPATVDPTAARSALSRHTRGIGALDDPGKRALIPEKS